MTKSDVHIENSRVWHNFRMKKIFYFFNINWKITIFPVKWLFRRGGGNLVMYVYVFFFWRGVLLLFLSLSPPPPLSLFFSLFLSFFLSLFLFISFSLSLFLLIYFSFCLSVSLSSSLLSVACTFFNSIKLLYFLNNKCFVVYLKATGHFLVY